MKNSGFTLVELVIVISVILAISLFAIPGIIGYQERQNEEQYVNQVINKLREFQTISITKDITTSVKFTSNNTVFCDNTGCQNISFPKNIYVNLSTGENMAYFNSFGDLVNGSGNLVQNDIVISTTNFNIRLNTYGGISKEDK